MVTLDGDKLERESMSCVDVRLGVLLMLKARMSVLWVVVLL